MNIAFIVVGWVLTVFLVMAYLKAARFKLTASIQTLVDAGLAWAAVAGKPLVRTIGSLELLGAIGIVLAPAASEFLGLSWAQPWGVAAAGGLTLVMVVGIIMHIARGEIKYTWKVNLALLLAALVLTVILSLYGGKLF